MNLVSKLQRRIEHLNRVTDEVWQLQLQNNDNSKVGRALGPRGKTLVVTFIQFVAEKDAALCKIDRSNKW